MLGFPLVNGRAYSFASVTLRVNGVPFRAIKAIDYTSGVERTKVRGTDRQAYGRTAGVYNGEASIEIWRENYTDFIASLGDGFMDVEFDVEVQFQEEGRDMQSVYLPSVLISKSQSSMQNNGDGLSVKVDLDVLLPIIEDDLSPISQGAQAIVTAAGSVSVPGIGRV